jgi:DNA-binding MarR family transcriptional regulator
MSEEETMAEAKCLVKLSKASNLCETLISKEFLVMISLIDEAEGLRVSDIHFLLGGNKSWVSNLCSRLARAGLATPKRDGREVYYNLTEEGQEVASTALALIKSLIKTDALTYMLSDNTYLLHAASIPDGKKITDYPKLGYPYHTHKGAILYNHDVKYLLFVGNDRDNRPFTLEIPIHAIHQVTINFDEYYKRRYLPRPKPLVIEYESSPEDPTNHYIYLFTQYVRLSHSTRNSDWLELIIDEKAKSDQEKEKASSKPEEDLISMVE